MRLSPSPFPECSDKHVVWVEHVYPSGVAKTLKTTYEFSNIMFSCQITSTPHAHARTRTHT